MITFKPSGINGFPCSTCNSSCCIHCHRKACLNCARYQHPDTKVIHIGVNIICHPCVQEIINLAYENDDYNFYIPEKKMSRILATMEALGMLKSKEQQRAEMENKL